MMSAPTAAETLGLTNFYRTFGGPLTLVVILCDVLKAVVAILIAEKIGSGFIEDITPGVSPDTQAAVFYVVCSSTGRRCSACWVICSPACSFKAARALSGGAIAL